MFGKKIFLNGNAMFSSDDENAEDSPRVRKLSDKFVHYLEHGATRWQFRHLSKKAKKFGWRISVDEEGLKKLNIKKEDTTEGPSLVILAS
jgi:predicted peroxiredoxin